MDKAGDQDGKELVERAFPFLICKARVFGLAVEVAHKYSKTGMTRNRSEHADDSRTDTVNEDITDVLQCSKAKGDKYRINDGVITVIEVLVLPRYELEDHVFAEFLCRTDDQHGQKDCFEDRFVREYCIKDELSGKLGDCRRYHCSHSGKEQSYQKLERFFIFSVVKIDED